MPRKSRGQRSLVGCSPWGHKESDTTEWLKHQEHSNHVPDIWGQEWAPLSVWPPCVYPWLLTIPLCSLAHSGRAQCLKSSPTFFLSLQMQFWKSKSNSTSSRQSPGSNKFCPLLNCQAIPGPQHVCARCMVAPPPFQSFSPGSKFQERFMFHISMTSDAGRDAEWWIHCYIDGDTRMKEIISLGFL